MKTLLTFIVSFSYCAIFAQTAPLVSNYPDTLWSETDTFYVHSDGWPEPWSFATTEGDTVDLGTDGYAGVSIKLWTSSDTVTVRYVNSPFKQWLYIPIASPKDTTIYRLRFNPQSAVFSEGYINQNIGQISFSIPETYELANIILFLSSCSQRTGNHPNSTYAEKVSKHFSAFKNHPLVKILDSQCGADDYFQRYYNFRENSICYEFEEDNLIYAKPYAHVWGYSDVMQGGAFRELAYLVQDFAIKTEFRKFYQENLTYYQRLENREKELMPIDKMWRWLEKEFPSKIQSYKVVFSPLIGGSHSTQKFHHGSFMNSKFYEVVMFVNSSESIDQDENYSEQQKEGLMSGIVFTEINHNYVNPTTSQYRKEVDSLLANLENWATKDALANYGSAYAVFNEYMTHALFCLYVQESYSEEIANFVIQDREALMDRRGFNKFKQFNKILLTRLEKESRRKPVAEYYPEVLKQMETIE